MNIRTLLDETQAAHVEAHGLACGVVTGFAPSDNPCVALRRAWIATFPERLGRDYYARHREEIVAYRVANRDQRSAACRRWREAHAEEARAAQARYRATHIDERRAAIRAYKRAHRSRTAELQRAHYARNREAINARRAALRKEQRANAVRVDRSDATRRAWVTRRKNTEIPSHRAEAGSPTQPPVLGGVWPQLAGPGSSRRTGQPPLTSG